MMQRAFLIPFLFLVIYRADLFADCSSNRPRPSDRLGRTSQVGESNMPGQQAATGSATHGPPSSHTAPRPSRPSQRIGGQSEVPPPAAHQIARPSQRIPVQGQRRSERLLARHSRIPQIPSERISGQTEASSSSRLSRPSERVSGQTQPMESILGPVVVVTGANRGLGFAILEELLERDGVKVVFATYRSTNKPFLDIAHKYGNGHNGKFVRIIQMEMKDPLRIKEGIEQINRGLDALVKGGILSKPVINTLINNAGIMDAAVVKGKLVDDKLGVHPLNADPNAYLEHFQVNTVAPITITSQLKRLLDESVGEPRVIFISSTISSMTEFAQIRSHQNVAYQNSKAALNSYMAILSKIKKEKPIDEAIEQLRVAYPELRDYYDHPEKDRSHLEFKQWIVLSLCPGWVETDMGNLADRTKSSPTDAKTAAARVVTAISSMSMDDSGSFYSLFFYTKEQIKGKKLAF